MLKRTSLSFAPLLCVLLFSLLCIGLKPATAAVDGLTCDFYDIPTIPDGWIVSMPPGINNVDKRSLGHFYNVKQKSSVMIQVSETERAGMSLEEVANKALAGLKENGCTILAGPVADGSLLRLELTLTGTPATMWIGCTGDFMAITTISGPEEVCRTFLYAIRNANPKLIPVPGDAKI